MLIKRILWGCIFLCFFSVAHAAMQTNTANQLANLNYATPAFSAPPNAVFHTSNEKSNWTFDVVPYLWALNMNGRVQVANQTSHVDQTFSDIMQQFDSGGMLWLDTYYKEKIGVFLNSLYASLSTSDTVDGVEIISRTRFGLFTLGAFYKAYTHSFGPSADKNRIELEPYVGARYTLNHTTLDVGTLLSLKDNQGWTDPIVGTRLNYLFNQYWLVTFAADVGGTNLRSDVSYNLVGLLGYKPASYATVYLGYHDLYQHYVTGHDSDHFDWQMRLFGPVLGLAFRF